METDDVLMSTGSTRPLEDAYRVSQHDLVTWVAALTGWELLDAYQLVSQAGLAPAGNVVDTNYTMVAKLAKAYLGEDAVVADGVHGRLRPTARSADPRAGPASSAPAQRRLPTGSRTAVIRRQSGQAVRPTPTRVHRWDPHTWTMAPQTASSTSPSSSAAGRCASTACQGRTVSAGCARDQRSGRAKPTA